MFYTVPQESFAVAASSEPISANVASCRRARCAVARRSNEVTWTK